jgi:glycosyltransferase involved in cell wall biosynthesis
MLAVSVLVPSRRRIAIDFSAIKTGGGVQRALTFLRSIEEEPWQDVDILFVLPPSGALSKFRPPAEQGSVQSPAGLLRRVWFEYVIWPRLLKARGIDTVFTFFGAGLPHPRSVRSIVGVAYPIICYPESPFWRHLSLVDGLRQRLKNLARVVRLKSATLVVAETEVMAGRLARTLNVSKTRFVVIPPSPTTWVDDRRDTGPRPLTFLFLSGPSPHKNLWRLPEIALALRSATEQPFVFLLSMRRASFLQRLPAGSTTLFTQVEACFEFVGPVEESKVGGLYARSDFLVNLSDLESFSNNYMESWRAGIPQIVSNRDFSRHICGGSAVYVEPHDPKAVTGVMLETMGDTGLRARLALEGRRRLKSLPTQIQATRMLRRLLVQGELPEQSAVD